MSKADEARYPSEPPPSYPGAPEQPSQQPPYPQQGYSQQSYPPQSYPEQAYPPQQVLRPGGSQVAPVGPGGTIGPQPVVVGQPITLVQRFHQTPVVMTCPHCQASITTSLEYKTGTITWLSAGVICLFMGWLGCCLIPFCVKSLKEVIHSCPECNREVGRYTRM